MTSLIVGLGNPGPDYASNRHNIGFMAVDAIAEAYGFKPWKKAFGGAVTEGIITPPPVGGRSGGGRNIPEASQHNSPHPNPPPKGEGKLLLFKPLGYMNTSGGPTGEITRFYKIAPEHCIVIHDELDLELGKIRVKRAGGHGGHNGLKSIDAHIGQDYWRVRTGIGHPGHKDLVSDYVLSDFRKEEWPIVQSLVNEITRHIAVLLQGDEAGFMNKISLAMKEE